MQLHHIVRGVLCTLLWTQAAASMAGPPRPVQAYKGSLQNEIPLSGTYVVGVLHAPDEAIRVKNTVFVWIPETRFERLCLSIRSIDGRYAGSGIYDISATPSGMYRIALDESARHLGRFLVGELTIDARVGANCEDLSTLRHVLGDWMSRPLENKVVLHVNSDAHDTLVFYRTRDGITHSVPCQKVASDKDKRIFNSLCVLEDAGEIVYDDAWLELRKFRERVASEVLSVAMPVR